MTSGPGFPQPDSEPRPIAAGGSAVVDAGAHVKAPAICLAIVGGIAFLVDSFTFLRFALDPGMAASVRQMFKSMEQISSASDADLQAGIAFAKVLFAVLAACGLVTLVGSIQMARLRSRGLAIAGAIFAMVSLANCCCAIGLPAGIWALVVLMKPDVVQAFEARRTQRA